MTKPMKKLLLPILLTLAICGVLIYKNTQITTAFYNATMVDKCIIHAVRWKKVEYDCLWWVDQMAKDYVKYIWPLK